MRGLQRSACSGALRSMRDIHVCFRAPPVRAGDFLLCSQEKVTKEKATPRTRPARFPALRVRSRPPGLADGPFLGLRRAGPHPAGHPSGYDGGRSPCSRGPVSRASCAQSTHRRVRASDAHRTCGVLALRRGTQGEGSAMDAGRDGRAKARCAAAWCCAYDGCQWLSVERVVRWRLGGCHERRPGWPCRSRVAAPLHAAAARRRMAEQAPNVRAQGCASSARLPFAEHRGQFERHDVVQTGMPGAAALVTFPAWKVTRAPAGARNRFATCRARARASHPGRNAP